MTINSYKDLTVWQKSMDLVEAIYKITSQMPKDEQYGLKSQMQRAAVAIPSNIAEGNFRHTRKDYAHFTSIALGSAAELETQLLICKRVEKFKEINSDDALDAVVEIKKMLFSLSSKLKLSSTET